MTTAAPVRLDEFLDFVGHKLSGHALNLVTAEHEESHVIS